jgi:hypothetical protein
MERILKECNDMEDAISKVRGLKWTRGRIRACPQFIHASPSQEIEAEVMGAALIGSAATGAIGDAVDDDAVEESVGDSRRKSARDIIKDLNGRIMSASTIPPPLKPAPPPTKKPPPPPPRVRRSSSSATYDFTASEDWQVDLTEGEVCEVVNSEDDGWTKVRKAGGVEGFVPTDYLAAGGEK